MAQGAKLTTPAIPLSAPQRQRLDVLASLFNDQDDESNHSKSTVPSEALMSTAAIPDRGDLDDTGSLVTARFKHFITEEGHAIITGRDGDTL